MSGLVFLSALRRIGRRRRPTKEAGGTAFDAAGSSFAITKIQNHNNNTDGIFGDADNVDWTAPTVFGGNSFPDGLIFVNENSGTQGGETWMMGSAGPAAAAGSVVAAARRLARLLLALTARPLNETRITPNLWIWRSIALFDGPMDL